MIIYNILITVTFIFLFPILSIMYGRNIFYRNHFLNYFGIIKFKKKSKTILLHSVSVGEINSAGWLIKKFHQLGYQIVITTTCEDGHDLIKKKFPFAEIFIFPFDLSFCVKKFINKISPELVIICETDFWPNFLYYSHKKSKLILLNGRISKNAYIYLRIFQFLSNTFFNFFDKIFVQSKIDRLYLNKIGLNNIIETGNTKLNIIPEFEKNYTINKKIITAGSTHIEDEKLLYKLLNKIDLLILAPRNLSRIKSIEKTLKHKQIGFIKYSQLPETNIEISQIQIFKQKILLIDKIGLLQDLYKYSTVFSYVGGGFSKKGLHNILEPLVKLSPVVFGENTLNFMDIANELIKNKIGFKICNEKELIEITHYFTKNNTDLTSKIKQYFNLKRENIKFLYDEISSLIN